MREYLAENAAQTAGSSAALGRTALLASTVALLVSIASLLASITSLLIAVPSEHLHQRAEQSA